MMSLKSLNNVFLMAMALMMLTLLNACSMDNATDSYEDIKTDNDAATYINLNIIVSNGAKNMTRADNFPTAGENGDGREAGFLRENAVTGVTLILYQDENGINGNDETKLDFVKYYPVERTGTTLTANGTDLGKGKVDETFYTTGNQRLNKKDIDITKSYHAIIIANADLSGKLNAKQNTLAHVRALILNTLYSGDETKTAEQCGNFVMSSEADYEMNFSTATPSAYENGLLYSFENIRIERMAARIDFWAAGSNGYKTKGVDNESHQFDYATPGYEYDVSGSNDKFVVTGITPFNLNGGNATNGGEYLIKRLAEAVTDPENLKVKYLIDENLGTYNYVLDPATQDKTDGELTYFKNRLLQLPPSGKTLADVTTLSSNAYYKSVAMMHSAVSASNSSAGFTNLTGGSLSGEDVIIAYPMENTLWESSCLFTCATGLAIEGDYYADGIDYTKPANEPTHLIFYGYLRHQGTASSYAATLGKNMSSTETVTAANCMEFGIVRNNIYRVSIDKVNVKQGTIKIKIEEKHWRHVDNPTIYI